jgi:hypothetical protein
MEQNARFKQTRKLSSGGEPPLILSDLGDRARLRLIVAHLGTHRDSKAVPGVDGGQGKHQRDQLLFFEVRSRALEDRVGHMAFRNPGDGVAWIQHVGGLRRRQPVSKQLPEIVASAAKSKCARLSLEA